MSTEQREIVLKTENLRKSFGSLDVLKGIDLEVRKGEVICIIGPSGAGKSTYLRSLNQLEKITSGKIFLNNELFLHREHNKTVHRIAPHKQKEMLLEMGMVFQRFNLFPHKTVLENVMISPRVVKKKSKEEAYELANKLIERVGLADKKDEYPSKLSGGQQQRVAIARALAMEPLMMLFDEPTSALDPGLRDKVRDIILSLKNESMTQIVVTHDLNFAREIADDILKVRPVS